MANENTAKPLVTEAPKATPSEAPKQEKPAITLASVLADRAKLIAMIGEVEAKTTPSDLERFAVENMREKLGKIDSQFGTMANQEIITRFFDLGSKLIADGVVTEAGKFVVTLAPGEAVSVSQLGAKQSARVDGEKGTKRKFGWNVDGKTEDTGATLIVKTLSDAITLVRAEYKPADVLGVCARKGWKVAASLGPVSIRQQGKVATATDGTKTWAPYPIVVDDKTTIAIKPVGSKLGAHKHGLLAVAKDRESEAVKWALSYLWNLIGDEGIADGAFKTKKPKADDIVKYLSSLHAIAEKAHASAI